MDTFWLKIAAFIVIIVVVIIGVMMIMPANDDKPKEPEKTFAQMVQKDRADITAEPNAADLKPTEPNEPAVMQQKKEPEPVIFYFTELSEIDKIQAEQIFAVIPSFKSIGRLPGPGYKTMVDSCHRLMDRFSGSIYDYKARRALAQVPQRYWRQYKITDELVDLSEFTKQRPNTYPYEPKEDD
jgi:hypothetical protein